MHAVSEDVRFIMGKVLVKTRDAVAHLFSVLVCADSCQDNFSSHNKR